MKFKIILHISGRPEAAIIRAVNQAIAEFTCGHEAMKASSRRRKYIIFAVLSHNRTYGSVSGGSISYCFLVVQKLFKQTDEFQFLKVTFGKSVVHVTCS